MTAIAQPNPSAELACGLAAEIVRSYGAVRLRVFGISMVPSILPGDLIGVRRAGVQEISSGDVVLYSRTGRLFVHRVVNRTVPRGAPGLEDPCLITRGDRQAHDDAPVHARELLGRVVSVERGNRQIEFAVRANAISQRILRLLLASDRATSLYLRLAEFRPMWMAKETK